MPKPKVSQALCLDARHWAADSPHYEALARRFQDAMREPGAPQIQEAMITLHWRKGTPWESSIKVGIRRTVSLPFGVRPALLYLRYGIWGRTRTLNVELDWHDPRGRICRLPVFLCPFCLRRCRYLYTAPDNAPGYEGVRPSAGDFCCRLCGGFCYASQTEYKSLFAQSMNLSYRLLADSYAERKTVTARDWARVHRAEALIARWVDKDTAPIEPNTEPRREWAELPPPVFTPKRGRGRPSLKKARAIEREMAKSVRQAQKEARPKRPVGRPKTRRVYDGSGRQAAGCSGRVGPQEGYCVGCKAAREIVGAEVFTARNGRVGIKGTCQECGRGLCRMGGSCVFRRMKRERESVGLGAFVWATGQAETLRGV